MNVPSRGLLRTIPGVVAFGVDCYEEARACGSRVWTHGIHGYPRLVPRAVFVCSSLGVGGAERQWGLLLPRLRDDFSVRVATLNGAGTTFEQLTDVGVPTLLVDRPQRGTLRALGELVTWAGREIDVVVTWSTDALVAGWILCRLTGAAHVVHEHSGIPIRGRRLLLTRILSPWSDRAVTVSASQTPLMLGYGFRPERIRVVPNGVDVASLAPTAPREAIRKKLGIDDTLVVALMLANPRSIKRFDVFAAGIAEARRRGRAILGLIVGDGPERAMIEDVQKANPHEIRWLGARNDVGDIISAADVVCLTSDVEGLPLSLIEAAACERAALATDVGGVREVVHDRETGLVVPRGDVTAFANALVTLADDPALRDRLGRAAGILCRRQFDIDVTARLFAAQMNAAIDERRGRRLLHTGRSK